MEIAINTDLSQMGLVNAVKTDFGTDVQFSSIKETPMTTFNKPPKLEEGNRFFGDRSESPQLVSLAVSPRTT